MNLIEAIQMNDALAINKALQSLYEKYYWNVKNFVLKNQGSEADAKDLFQDGLMIVYDNVKANKFKSESSLETYLFAICRNVWLHRIQKVKKHEALFLEILPDEQPDHSNTNIGQLEYVMRELKKDCQKVLIEFYYHKKSIPELKEIMGMNSDQVVKNKKKRCLNYLMEIIRQKKLSKESFFDGKNIQ